ncbi:MAG: AAA-like domain-containing protein [Cyanobacteria bacterium P01_F01_bin.150]
MLQLPNSPTPPKSKIQNPKFKTAPLSNLELPYESVPLDSPFYIQRSPHEPQCYQSILEPGALLRIKAPRQMGKTSLMMRILAHAETQGCQRVVVNFQQADQRILEDGDRLLRWMCANMARQLKLPPNLDEFWDEDIGSKMSCTLYMEEYLLEEVDKPIVLALEEVSELFDQAAVAQDIFTMIRSWYGNTKSDPLWQQLRMVMVYSTELYVPLNINQSPFNVGLELALQPFEDSQVEELVQRHALSLSSEQLAQLQQLVAGHLHLIRLALYTLAKERLSFDDFLDTAATDAGVYHDHLHRHLWRLEQHPELGDALRQVLTSVESVELNQVYGFKLYSMGLVNLDRNKVSVQCELYQKYFSDRLSP